MEPLTDCCLMICPLSMYCYNSIEEAFQRNCVLFPHLLM